MTSPTPGTEPEPDLSDVLAPFWSESHTLEALSLTAEELAEQRALGRVLGVPTSDGDYFYPVFQFQTHHGAIRVNPGLRPFTLVLRDHDPWTVGVLLKTPAEELDGLTPEQWVREGKPALALFDLAKRVDADLGPPQNMATPRRPWEWRTPRPSLLLALYRDGVEALARGHGAEAVRVFGSIARGEDAFGSDVDLLVRFTPDATQLDTVALRDGLEDLLGAKVDVVSEAGLVAGRHAHDAIRAEAVPLAAVLPGMDALRELSQELGNSRPGILQWLYSSTTYFDPPRRPVDVLYTDPDLVLDVARRAWTVEW